MGLCVCVVCVHKCVCWFFLTGIRRFGCVGVRVSLGFPVGVLFSVYLPLGLYVGAHMCLFGFVPR